MTGLKKRAQALENQFARDAELQFKSDIRCTAMLGRWAAYTMGLDDVEAYARTLTMRQVVEPHGLIDQLYADLRAAGIAMSAADLDRRVHDFSQKAAQDVFTGH